MKKIFLISIVLVLTMSVVFAQAQTENLEPLKLAVMQGPTGFSSALIEGVDISVYPSPNEVVARLANGELDMACLPANAAANLYNKGVKIKAVAVVGEGMLSMLYSGKGEDKVVYVPSAGSTPDHFAQMFCSDYQIEYSVTAPAQIAQLMIAKKISYALLPEPFVTMVKKANKDCSVVKDLNQDYQQATGKASYPMSILVVSDKALKEKTLDVINAMASYEESVKSVLADPHAAAVRIEELGIMKQSLAEGAIPNCNLVFKKSQEAQEEILEYYGILLNLAPEAIGSKNVDEDFFF